MIFQDALPRDPTQLGPFCGVWDDNWIPQAFFFEQVPLDPVHLPIESPIMTRLAISGVTALLIVCQGVFAQIPDSFLINAGPLESSFLTRPGITLANQDRISLLTAMNWQTPTDYLPAFQPIEPKDISTVEADQRDDASAKIAELSTPQRIRVGGEFGFLYGRSTGKYGYEYEQGYLIGEIGNDWFHLTIGMSRSQTNWRLPRR